MPGDTRIPIRNGSIAAEVERGGSTVAWLPIVAADAVMIQHRLDFACKGEAASGSEPRPNLVRCPFRCRRGQVRTRFVLPLVAANACQHFSRHRGEPAAHQLQCTAIGVQRLHRNRRAGGDTELGRSVRLHGHGSQDAFDIPGPVHPHRPEQSAHTAITEFVRDEPELLDGSAWNTPQTRGPGRRPSCRSGHPGAEGRSDRQRQAGEPCGGAERVPAAHGPETP